MYGAILGDIIGSPYEFDRGTKTKEFPFFDKGCRFTDDTVMTIAVAEALMLANGHNVSDDEVTTKDFLIDAMHKWGQRYPDAGYGGTFYGWLADEDREPYNSWGNGSAMRVSSAGWLYDDMDTTRRIARWTAEVTHNHPEGVKGAESVASAIFMARNNSSKDEIRSYITKEFGYDLNRTADDIRPTYSFDVSCQGSVPEAIISFLDGESFEDVIRTAVSLGGDTDTIGAIAGSIAEAFYGVSDELKSGCEKRLPDDLADILLMFHDERRVQLFKETIKQFESDRSPEMLMTLLWYLKSTLLWVPCNAVMSEKDQAFFEKMISEGKDIVGTTWSPSEDIRMVPDILMNGDDYFFPAFTSPEEMGEYGDSFSKVQKHIMEVIGLAKGNEKDVVGVVINAFTEPFVLDKALFEAIEKMNRADDN